MKVYSSCCLAAAATLFVFLPARAAFATDRVEFVNGSEANGTVKQIRKVEKEFDFETSVGSRTFTRTYSFSEVHAVTMKGKRYEFAPKPDAGTSRESLTRTRAEVKSVVEAAGTTPPDWFDSTPLYYPKTLDLSWPLKPATKVVEH